MTQCKLKKKKKIKKNENTFLIKSCGQRFITYKQMQYHEHYISAEFKKK